MSPDARLIAATQLFVNGWRMEEIAPDVRALENALVADGMATPQPGIRGMVPVAYLKDVIEGFIARLDACQHLAPDHLEAMNYAKRRLADVDTL